MRFHFGWKSNFGVQSALYLCSHKLRRNETQNSMDFISIILTKMKFRTGMRFCVNRICPKQNESAQSRWILRLMRICVWTSLRVWISYRSFWQKWISFRVIKYHVNTTGNEMSIKISDRFEMQPKWNFMWTELVFTPVWNFKPVWFHFASHVNVL